MATELQHLSLLHPDRKKRVGSLAITISSLRGVQVNQERDHSSLFVPVSTQDHIQGVLNAGVVLVMYGDYQSPQSADVYRLIKAIQRQLCVSFEENSLCFILRHFPQYQIHTQAQRAAEAAEAAAIQV